MTLTYLVVGKGGITEHEVKGTIPTEIIKEVVGREADGNSYMECIAERFHDPAIDIWANEEGLVYDLACYASLPATRELLCGHLLICANSKAGNAIGLTPGQVKIVKKQIHAIPEGTLADDDPGSSFQTFESFEEMQAVVKADHDALRERVTLKDQP